MQNQPLPPCVCASKRPAYRIDLMNIHSGLSESDHEFQNKYHLHLPRFNLECIRCCLLYLRRKRGYNISEGSLDIVTYPELQLQPELALNTPSITAYLKVPTGGGRKGQIATGHDLNLGYLSARPFESSRTYQIYSPGTGTLSVGFNAQVRMESVAIDVVTKPELDDIKVNYAVAVLIEKYLETRGKDTLQGCCSIRPAPVP